MKQMDFGRLRREMVTDQIKSRGISDTAVLAALGAIPRERFVPDRDRDSSYLDGPLQIGMGQTISQPYIVAFMTEKLKLTGSEKVLEIGTGSGYQSAVLAEITRKVYTVEVVAKLADRAKILLAESLGYNNIQFKTGDGKLGWLDEAPFDRILLTAAPKTFPEALFDQLGEGGIAIAPVGSFHQDLMKFTKRDGNIKTERLIGVVFVPLI